MKIKLIIIFALLVSGCASDKEMRERFKNSDQKILKDTKSGERYIVEWRIGDNYSIKPWYGVE